MVVLTSLALVVTPSSAFGSGSELSRPSLCGARHTKTTVVSFLRDFNRGAPNRLNREIAREPDFIWYSVSGEPGQRLNEQATDRSSLIPYFKARHAHHEHLSLTSFTFNGRHGGYGNFQYRLMRQADDLADGTPVLYVGKGALSCRIGRIAVWSMG